MAPVSVGSVEIGAGGLTLIAGPCTLESLDMGMVVARKLRDLCAANGVGYVFKASFDKANRTSRESRRGPGLAALPWLAQIRDELGVAVLTDVHTPDQPAKVAPCVDMLQIPAFLCRQTDLLEAAGATGLPVNIKKGQFVAAPDMAFAAEKVGGPVMITERGSCFGKRDLVVDFRELLQLRELGYPVVFDATHSAQQPGGSTTGGSRATALALARAGLVVGVDALFCEVHPHPASAWSDASTQIPLAKLAELLPRWVAVHKLSPMSEGRP